MLRSLTEDPLKPQLKMAITRCNLMPKMYHGLVLAVQPAKGLETLDRTVRATIRKWLRLPNDTPLGFFNAKVRDGELCIPRLCNVILCLHLKRLRKLMMSEDELIVFLTGQSVFPQKLSKSK